MGFSAKIYYIWMGWKVKFVIRAKVPLLGNSVDAVENACLEIHFTS